MGATTPAGGGGGGNPSRCLEYRVRARNHSRRLEKFGADTQTIKFADVSYYPIDRNRV